MRALYSPLALIISGFLTGLAQQPLELGWLAWFSLLPLLFVFHRIETFKHFLITGFIWGCAYFLTVIFWLASNLGTTFTFGVISLILAVLFCSLNIVLLCFLTKLVKDKYENSWFWLFPFIWTSVEYVRNLDILSGGPWTSLANTQLDFLTLAQNAEITGVYGITFWVVCINVLIFNYLIRPFPEHYTAGIIVFIFPWITGLWLTPDYTDNIEDDSKLSVSIVQPNIHQKQKWKPGLASKHLQILIDESRPAIEDSIELIIWPETSTSAYLLQGNDFFLKWIQSELSRSNLIAGITFYSDDGERKYYNSAAHIEKDTVNSVYHKLRLVPVGEYIPFSNYFPSLSNIDLGQGNFSSGTEYVIMEVNGVKCAVMICFESTMPYLSREFVNRGAELLIFLVNDGWYENPPQPQQHAKQVVYRAIENRRPVLRGTNTGISLIVDERGNISHKIPLNERGAVQSVIKPVNYSTFYTRHGDIFAQLNVLISIIFILSSIIKRK